MAMQLERYDINLPIQQIMLIAQALHELPYKVVSPLINDIQAQLKAQEDAEEARLEAARKAALADMPEPEADEFAESGEDD